MGELAQRSAPRQPSSGSGWRKCFQALAQLTLALGCIAFPHAKAGVALAATPTPTPEQILADASRYTVKVQVLNEIALNQDDGGAAMGTGFAVGPNSTKSRITSFCIHS